MIYHAEHVGSLLRPPALAAARAAFAAGTLDRDGLRAAEDQAALANLAMLREVGMPVLTDGEVRRANWMAGALEALGGVEPIDAPTGLGWHRDGAPDPEPEDTKFQLVAARERLSRRVRLTATEAAFLLDHAAGQFKITMMSASMGTMLWAPGISDAAYPTPADLITDLAALQAEELGELVGGPDRHRRVNPGLLPRLDPGLGPHLGVRLLVAADFDVPGRVAVQYALLDGQVERGAQGGPQVAHRRGGLRAAFGVAGVGDRREHRAQKLGVEVGQPVAAQVGDQDGIHVAGVVEPGRRPDVGTRVEPMPKPPLDRPALRRAVRRGAGQELVTGLPSGRLRRIAAPPCAFPGGRADWSPSSGSTRCRARARRAEDRTAQGAAGWRRGTRTA